MKNSNLLRSPSNENIIIVHNFSFARPKRYNVPLINKRFVHNLFKDPSRRGCSINIDPSRTLNNGTTNASSWYACLHRFRVSPRINSLSTRPLISKRLPPMLTKSQRWLLEGGGRNESWNPVLPYSRNIRSVFKEERKGEEKRRIRRRLSSDVGQKWRKEGSEERRLCADWSASSSPSRAAFQSKLILTILVAFFDLRQCGGAREEAACAVP